MGRWVDRPVLDFGARWILAKKVVTFPIPRRSDSSRNKATTAIRTDVAQNVIDARGAKRALVGTDARFNRVGWQLLVAVLAGRPEFKHRVSFLLDV
jgi:hypothetical protein